jgi:hypothetical protein
MRIIKLGAVFSVALLSISFSIPACGQQVTNTSVKVPDTSTRSDEIVSVSDQDIAMFRKDLRDQKKQIVAANLPLTGDEAAQFWPIYDAYTQETIKINDGRYALVKEYGSNYATMTDDQAADYIRRWLAVDEASTKLRSAWIGKFESVLGEKKAAIFFQIDRRIGMVQELQLASQLPLVLP